MMELVLLGLTDIDAVGNIFTELVTELPTIENGGVAFPGAPVYHSLMPGIMHPRTGAFMGGAWEVDMFYSVGVELAHMWGVPTLAGIGTGADTSSWESALGITSNMLLCALCGAETGSGIGLRETCTLLTPEALVLDTEFYHQVRLDVKGLDTSREAMALDVLKKVGSRGHFLTQQHTREGMRSLEFSDLIAQPEKGGRGYRDPIDVAVEKTHWILKNHEPEPLSEVQQLEMNRLLQAAGREIT